MARAWVRGADDLYIAIVAGYIVGSLLFVHGGCRLLLALFARPDSKYPLNPRAARRDFAVILGTFGGLALWNSMLFFGVILWRSHMLPGQG
jgi:hypothetical protein